MSTRITVRLDEALYARLLLFAQGRSQGQPPEVSTIVREALEAYLTPRDRQTGHAKTRHLSDTFQQNVTPVRHSKGGRPV